MCNCTRVLITVISSDYSRCTCSCEKRYSLIIMHLWIDCARIFFVVLCIFISSYCICKHLMYHKNLVWFIIYPRLLLGATCKTKRRGSKLTCYINICWRTVVEPKWFLSRTYWGRDLQTISVFQTVSRSSLDPGLSYKTELHYYRLLLNCPNIRRGEHNFKVQSFKLKQFTPTMKTVQLLDKFYLNL